MILRLYEGDMGILVDELYKQACEQVVSAQRNCQEMRNLRRNYYHAMYIYIVVKYPTIIKPGSPQWRDIPQNPDDDTNDIIAGANQQAG